MFLVHVLVLSSSGHWGAWLHAVLEGPRLSEALPPTFKLDIVISNQLGKRKEPGASHMRSAYGPAQEMVLITSSHIPWLELRYIAPPSCEGNWTL